MTQMQMLKDLAADESVLVNAATIAPIMGTEAQAIRIAARNGDNLGFPVVIVKKRVMIPRIPFLRFMGCDV